MIIHEHARMRGCQQAPAGTNVLEPRNRSIEGGLQAAGVVELVHIPNAGVLGGLDGLRRRADDLVDPVQVLGGSRRSLDCGDIRSRHVLGRVDPETLNPKTC